MDPIAKYRATLLYEIRWQKQALKKKKKSKDLYQSQQQKCQAAKPSRHAGRQCAHSSFLICPESPRSQRLPPHHRG